MYDAVLDWGLKLGPTALEASSIPLGYRGDGVLIKNDTTSKFDMLQMYLRSDFIASGYMLQTKGH